MEKSELSKRVIVAVVLVLFALFMIFRLETPAFALVIAGIMCAGAWEWGKLSALNNPQCYVYVVCLGVAVLLLYFYPQSLEPVTWVGVVWWGCSLPILVFYQKGHVSFLRHIPVRLAIGFFCLVPLWAAMVLLHWQYQDILLCLMLLVWAADIGAYICGRRWGKNKLASLVSPGKTWEGVVGGAFAGVVVSLGYFSFIETTLLSLRDFIFLCVMAIVASVIGDLVESMIKRIAGKKDSSQCLPGHGGIMDRVDSLTAAAPVFLGGVLLASSWV